MGGGERRGYRSRSRFRRRNRIGTYNRRYNRTRRTGYRRGYSDNGALGALLVGAFVKLVCCAYNSTSSKKTNKEVGKLQNNQSELLAKGQNTTPQSNTTTSQPGTESNPTNTVTPQPTPQVNKDTTQSGTETKQPGTETTQSGTETKQPGTETKEPGKETTPSGKDTQAVKGKDVPQDDVWKEISEHQKSQLELLQLIREKQARKKDATKVDELKRQEKELLEQMTQLEQAGFAYPGGIPPPAVYEAPEEGNKTITY